MARSRQVIIEQEARALHDLDGRPEDPLSASKRASKARWVENCVRSADAGGVWVSYQ